MAKKRRSERELKRSRAAKKGWETRRKSKAEKSKAKVAPKKVTKKAISPKTKVTKKAISPKTKVTKKAISPKTKLQKLEAENKRLKKKLRESRKKRAAASRLGWDRRREREAIQAEAPIIGELMGEMAQAMKEYKLDPQRDNYNRFRDAKRFLYQYFGEGLFSRAEHYCQLAIEEAGWGKQYSVRFSKLS